MNKKSSISVVVSAFNEEKKIGACLDSVKHIADEIIVVNNSSTDKTEEIVKKYTSKIYKQQNNPIMLNINKNFGIEKASGKWILYLDADERVSEELANEIRTSVAEEPCDGFLIPRKNIIFGKWIKSEMWWPDCQLRLFRRGKGRYPEKHVHELIEVDGKVGRLSSPLIHLNYETISQYINKMDKIYTENEVKVLLTSGKKIAWTDALWFPTNDFLKTFFFQKGYKDGLHGLVLSILQAFYAEVVFAKWWETQNFPDEQSTKFLLDTTGEMDKIGRDARYWIYTSIIQEAASPIKIFYYKVLRKLIKQ